jgi:hypothetical protein
MGKSNRVHGEVQGDLFGKKARTPRGWTELDKIRRRYATLEKKVAAGDYTSEEREEHSALGVQIKLRENEAREKWERSFKK